MTRIWWLRSPTRHSVRAAVPSNPRQLHLRASHSSKQMSRAAIIAHSNRSRCYSLRNSTAAAPARARPEWCLCAHAHVGKSYCTCPKHKTNTHAPAPGVVLTKAPHHAAVTGVAAQWLNHACDISVRGENAHLSEAGGRDLGVIACMHHFKCTCCKPELSRRSRSAMA